MNGPASPPVPEASLANGGWEKQEEQTETLFEMPGMRVRGTTLQYEDTRSREALRKATHGAVDRQIRFFALTRLGFEPPPPPGIGPAMFLPILRTEVRRRFADQLEQRGLTEIERGRSKRHRLPDRSRVRLRKFTARDKFGNRSLSLECWVGVWTSGSDVFVVSGGYPQIELAEQLDLDTADDILTRSPNQYREEFFSLVRGVAAVE